MNSVRIHALYVYTHTIFCMYIFVDATTF